jgi:hypothetical protein
MIGVRHTNLPSPVGVGRQGSLAWAVVVLSDGGVVPAARRAGLAGGHDELPALHGHGRTRSVCGMGGVRLTVTPRRARCADCAGTQILLPTELTVRRADSTEVIGAGFRAIAEWLDRPASTVRPWLRHVPDAHARWLYQRAVESAATYDRELLVRPEPHKTGARALRWTCSPAPRSAGGSASACRPRRERWSASSPRDWLLAPPLIN